MKVEKDWVHMDKVEFDKLEWMKDLPKPTAGDTEVFILLALIEMVPDSIAYADGLNQISLHIHEVRSESLLSYIRAPDKRGY